MNLRFTWNYLSSTVLWYIVEVPSHAFILSSSPSREDSHWRQSGSLNPDPRRESDSRDYDQDRTVSCRNTEEGIWGVVPKPLQALWVEVKTLRVFLCPSLPCAHVQLRGAKQQTQLLDRRQTWTDGKLGPARGKFPSRSLYTVAGFLPGFLISREGPECLWTPRKE